MTKFFSVLFFAVALTFTWHLIHSDSAIGAETHSGIQEEMSTLIVQTLQSKKPNAKEIRITRMWTENLDEHKVRAVFAYHFTEAGENNETLEQTIEGEAILHREPSDDPRLDKWVLQQVRTTNDAVNFTEGTVVTPVPGADEQPETGTPATE